jgi:hypothetical protein
MAGEKNFIVKNGLSVGTADVLDSSGDLTAAAFGTAAKEAIDDQVNALLTAGSGVSLTYDDAAGTLTVTRDAETGDISSVVAGDGLSGGATAGDATLALDLSELTAAAVDVANDSIAIVDANDSNGSRKESIADLATAMAGTNITASNGVLSSLAGDVTGVTAGDGLSGGGTSGALSLALDLNELTAAAVAVASDSISIIDASDSNTSRKESIADLVSAMAGTNLTATNGVLSSTADLTGVTAGDGLSGGGTSGAITLALDLNELTAATVAAAADSIVIIDATDNSSKKESIVDLGTAMAGDGLTSAAGALAVGVDDSSIETSGDALRVKASGVTNAMLANSTFTVSDGSNTSPIALGGTVTYAVGEGLDVVESAGTVTFSAEDATVSNKGVASFVTADFSVASGAVSLQAERIQDLVGAMVSSNTESGITVAYEDGDGTIDFTVGTLNQDTTGTAALFTASANNTANETVYPVFVDGATGSQGAETDTGFTYNPSTGVITATQFTGNVTGTLTGTASSIANHDTGDLTEGSNLYHTTARARATVSVTDAGGDGSAAYNSSTGVITYTGPSAAEVRAHSSGGTGVTYSSGAISIGQAVATSSNVTFGNLILSGDLTVNGATTTVGTTNTVVSDNLIELNNGAGSNANDSGIVIERGSTGNNAIIAWDESADGFVFGTTTATGASTGNLTIAPVATSTGALTITNASNSGGTARNVYQSTSAPAGGDGAVGDLWILYS